MSVEQRCPFPISKLPEHSGALAINTGLTLYVFDCESIVCQLCTDFTDVVEHGNNAPVTVHLAHQHVDQNLSAAVVQRVNDVTDRGALCVSLWPTELLGCLNHF